MRQANDASSRRHGGGPEGADGWCRTSQQARQQQGAATLSQSFGSRGQTPAHPAGSASAPATRPRPCTLRVGVACRAASGVQPQATRSRQGAEPAQGTRELAHSR